MRCPCIRDLIDLKVLKIIRKHAVVHTDQLALGFAITRATSSASAAAPAAIAAVIAARQTPVLRMEASKNLLLGCAYERN
jgi:hypothetical protein